MSAGPLDLYIEQGTTWSALLEWRDDTTDALMPLAGHSVRSQIRDKPGGALVHEFTVAVEVDGVGTFRLSASAAETAALPAKALKYDVKITRPDASVFRLLEGRVTVSPEVTV